MEDFDPNGAATEGSGIFGFPYSIDESALILIPIPWEATATYGSGCSRAPKAIFEASMFVELYDKDLGNFYEKGIALKDNTKKIVNLNKKAKRLAKRVINNAGNMRGCRGARILTEANKLCGDANLIIQKQVSEMLDQKKFVGLIGGDHSIALGSIIEHVKRYPDMGVLQIDAHCDLRKAFENLTYSHASVMHNVISQTPLKSLTQLGVRGFCQEEYDAINSSERITTYFDNDIHERVFGGENWENIIGNIVSKLPQEVYISLDIDGLDPKLCPGTGTPVPGGFDYQSTRFLLKKLVQSGRKIVGFDLVEVAPSKNGNWDSNLAAHLLYQLSGWSIISNY